MDRSDPPARQPGHPPAHGTILPSTHPYNVPTPSNLPDHSIARACPSQKTTSHSAHLAKKAKHSQEASHVDSQLPLIELADLNELSSQGKADKPGTIASGAPLHKDIAPAESRRHQSPLGSSVNIPIPSDADAATSLGPFGLPAEQSIACPLPATGTMREGSSEAQDPRGSASPADEVHTPSHTPKRNRGGRPRSATKRGRRGNGPTRLRMGKPVASEVPMDVWEMVLPYCPGKFLAKARQINRSFHRTLSYESIWRRNRLQLHGTELPGPFPGMREDEYANLLEGLGCMDCGNPRTRKTYWLWQKRWCIACLQKHTLKHEDATALLLECPDLLDECVPYGLVDSWGSYEMAGIYDRFRMRQGHAGQRIYSKADIYRLLEEWEQVRPKHFVHDKIPEERRWWHAKKAERDRLMDRSQKIENWIEKRAQRKLDENRRLKKQRAEFFEARALALEPPIEPAALRLIPAFKRAVEIAKPAGERNWKALLPKLLEVGDEARDAAKLGYETVPPVESGWEMHQKISERWRVRECGELPELIVLERITKQVMDDLKNASPPVADVDLGLLALRTIRRKWQELQESGNDGECADHNLSLADAQWTWNHEVRRIVESWGTRSMRRVSRLFQCPICIRNDVRLRFTFDNLFHHLNSKHANVVGNVRTFFGSHAGRYTVKWFDMTWPLNLPILADHHVASGQWDPDDESHFVLAPAVDMQIAQIPDSIDVRHIRMHEGALDNTLTENIIYAGRLFRDTQLEPVMQTKIVVRYALDCYRLTNRDEDPVDDQEDIQFIALDLFKAGLFDLFDGLRCKACIESEPRLSRYSAKIRSPSTLFDHFRRWHSDQRWYESMVQFPDDNALWRALSEPGMEKAVQAFETLFPRTDQTYQQQPDQQSVYRSDVPSHDAPSNTDAVDPSL